MTTDQMTKVRELCGPKLRARMSNRERAEMERIAGMSERSVLSVELAAWIEKVYARAVKVSAAGRR